MEPRYGPGSRGDRLSGRFLLNQSGRLSVRSFLLAVVFLVLAGPLTAQDVDVSGPEGNGGQSDRVELGSDRQREPSDADDDRPKADVARSSGEFLGQRWHIDRHHLMWFDGKPYVPFGGFGVKPGSQLGLRTHNLWIDFDPFIDKPHYTRDQHRRDIAQRLRKIGESGGTCIVQFSMALPHLPGGPRPGMRWREPEGGIDASRLADPKVREAIFKVWAEYAPAVRHECVRGIVLWNEINVWRWPERISVDEYAEVLGRYVRQAKQLVGDVPVCFKTAGTWNAEAAIAAASAADGLGFDVWFREPNDARARAEIQRALRMLEARQKKTTWFFIAEGGRGIAEGGTDEARDVKNYWDNWPPFRSKREAQGILRAYARAGAKGFIYNGPSSDTTSAYYDSYRWLGELRQQMVDLIVDTKRPAADRRAEITAVRAVSVASADRKVQQLLEGAKALRVEVEFSQQWGVWLVHFFSGPRRAALASVSTDGRVLEVGPGAEGDEEYESEREGEPTPDRGNRRP